MDLQELVQRIDALKAEIDTLRPLPSDLEGRILQKFRLDWNYHSSNIEGNALTYGETKTLLLHGLTVGGKPLRDYLEVKGHNDAVFELDDIVRRHAALSEHAIRSMHQLILGRESYQIPARTAGGEFTERTVTPGRYKQEPNHVITATGETFYFTSPENTPIEMEKLLAWYDENSAGGELHPLVLGAMLHYRFIRIHPFDDGNGRIARILMNLVFMQNGYPPAIIRTEDKENYYRALQVADGGDVDAFAAYVGEQLLRSCEIYMRGARGENIEEGDDVDKAIALFKAELGGNGPNDVVDVFSGDTAVEIVTSSFVPLLKLIDDRLHQFDEMFLHKWYDLRKGQVHGEGGRSSQLVADHIVVLEEVIDQITSLLNGELVSSPFLIEIKFHWDVFRHNNAKSIGHVVAVSVRFDRVRYSIESDPSLGFTVSKPYPQALTEREQESIAIALAKVMLEKVRSYLPAGAAS